MEALCKPISINVRFTPESGHRNRPVSASTQQLRQLRHVGRDASRFILREQLGRRSAARLFFVRKRRAMSAGFCRLLLTIWFVFAIVMADVPHKDRLSQLRTKESDVCHETG